jgi:hypothetical protein
VVLTLGMLTVLLYLFIELYYALFLFF